MSNSLLHRSSNRMVTRDPRKLANDGQLHAITFCAVIAALVFSPSASKAIDYNWTGGSNDFNNANNWNPAPAIFNLGNNFFIAAAAQNPFMTANTTLGNLTINGGILTLNSNFTLSTNGLTINNGGQFVSNNLNTINGNATINAGGSWQLNGSLVHNGNLTNAGTLTAGANDLTGIATLTNTGVITGSSGIRATTIVNSGTITGANFGIDSGANVITLTNSGTISGGTNAVILRQPNNIININPGAVFNGGIDFKRFANTINFGSGSYTVRVKNFNQNVIAINVTSPTTQVIVKSGIDDEVGNLVIKDAPAIAVVDATTTKSALSSPTNQTQEFTRSVSFVVSDILSQVNTIGVTCDLPHSRNYGEPASLGQNVCNEFGDIVPNSGGLNTTSGALTPVQGAVSDGKGNLFWSRAFAGTRFQPAVAGLPASQSYFAGAAVGYDRRFEEWRIGAFAGYGSTALNTFDGSGNVKGDLFFAGLYGRRELGQWIFDLGLSAGTIGNKSARYINGSNGLETANAAFTGFFIAPELAVSYAYRLDPAWTVTPTARLRYNGSFYGSYGETGSSQNITYAPQSAHLIEERAEIKLDRMTKLEDGLWFNSYLRGAVFGIHRIGPDVTIAQVLDTDITVKSAISKDLFGASLGAGFDWKIHKDWTLFAGADALFYTNGSNGFTSRVGMRVRF